MSLVRPLAAGAALFSALGCGDVSAALMARDEVPASTLLIPYFEVDPSGPDAPSTFVTWRNASATAMLTHVTIWTDLGVPAINFNVYLTGYDVVSMDLRDVLVQGVLPVTATNGQDPGDTISNQGPVSQDINFASCNGQLPYATPALFASTITNLNLQLSGKPSPLNGLCSGFNHGDEVLRGFITIDTVNNCTAQMPSEPGYFVNGGAGSATLQNAVAGEYLLTGPGGRMLHSGPAVAIEADLNVGSALQNPETTTPGEYTFYGRFVAWTAQDNRETLPATWAADTQAQAAELIVWRDPKAQVNPFTCGQPFPPALFPLGHEAAINFDRQAQPTEPALNDVPFQLVAQRVAVGAANFPAAQKPGWSYVSLNSVSVGAGPNPPEDPQAAQAYVAVIQHPEIPGFGGGSGVAAALDNAGTGENTHFHPREITP